MALLDSYNLGINPTFRQRVQTALLVACNAIANEALVTANHVPRLQLVHSILTNPTQLANYVDLFSAAVATDAIVAVGAGSVVGDATPSQAKVADADISNAIAGMFNTFCPGITGL